MAEPAGTPPQEPQGKHRPPRPGGTDTLTQLLDDGLQPLDAPLPGPVLTGHPWETPPEGEPGQEVPAGGPAPSPAPQYRYQSQDEAERAEREAQQRITEETQRRAALEREVELYRQHNALLERQIQQGTQTTPGEPDTTPQATPTFSAKDHFQQAYQRMAALNPAADDFETQQQGIFIDALDSAFSRLSQTTALTEAQITAKIEAGIQAALPTIQAQVVTREANRIRMMGKITNHATNRGLDFSEDGVHYQDVMYAINNNLYPADANEDEAIAYVIEGVAGRRGVASPAPPAGSPPGQPGARPASTPSPTPSQRAQALNTPMERSGMGRPQQAPDEMDSRSFSLSEMLNRSMRVRQP